MPIPSEPISPATHGQFRPRSKIVAISEIYAAISEIKNILGSATSSRRSSTPARQNSTCEAHAGHCIELLPTELQSWHR